MDRKDPEVISLLTHLEQDENWVELLHAFGSEEGHLVVNSSPHLEADHWPLVLRSLVRAIAKNIAEEQNVDTQENVMINEEWLLGGLITLMNEELDDLYEIHPYSSTLEA